MPTLRPFGDGTEGPSETARYVKSPAHPGYPLNAYMGRRALQRLLREGDAVSGAFLAGAPTRAGAPYGELKRMPAVGGVAIRLVALQSFEDTLARSMGIFIWVLVGFACVVEVAIVYNAARIALSERGRELASLRVLGFTRRAVAVLLLGEQAILTVLAIPPGFFIGYQLTMAIGRRYQWELFRMPLFVSSETYAFAVVVLTGAALGSAALVRRRLDRLDLVEVLKTRERNGGAGRKRAGRVAERCPPLPHPLRAVTFAAPSTSPA